MFKKIINSNISFYALVIVCSVIAFIGTYGYEIINPTNIGLYYARGDWTQHYFGWVGFRNSYWQFPLGLYDNNTYPDSTSIIFTDSIPIFAIIFKLFRGFLPGQFQYFGIFTLCCYMAQAIVSARIVKRFTNNKIFALISSVLFSFVPIILHRAFMHEALSAQFLILIMIETMFLVKELKPISLYVRVGICAILAAGIHMYFVLICGIVLVGVCLNELLHKKYIECIISLIEYVAVAALMVWIEGGFSSGIETSQGTVFGSLNANINTLYNSMGESILLPDLGKYSWGQADGFAYLGLGCIFLALCAVIAVIIERNRFAHMIKNNIKLFISIIVVIVLSAFFAFMPNFSINERLLFSINLPDFVEGLIANFRCNGRIIWIMVYLVMLLSAIVIYRCINKYVALSLVSIAVIVQVIDVSPYLTYKYENTIGNYQRVTEFDTDSLTQEIKNDDSVKHIVLYADTFFFISDLDAPTDEYVWAIENNKTTNYIYLARKDTEKLKDRTKNALENPREDTLYVFSEYDENVCQQYGLFYKVSGRFIFARSIPI